MKLGALSIWLLGLAVFIAAASYGLFQHYMPNNEETKIYEAYRDQLTTEVNKKNAAQKRLKDAGKLAEAKVAEWKAIVNEKTPSQSLATGGIDVNQNPLKLVNDVPVYRDNLQTLINQQMTKGGVQLIGAGPLVPFSSENPNEVLSFFNFPGMAFPVVILEFGPIRVKGTYEQIKAHVKSWSTFPRYLAVADGLQLAGTSPTMIGTYNVNIVGLIRAKEVWQPIPEDTGAAAAPAGGGGGAPQGVPGGPPNFQNGRPVIPGGPGAGAPASGQPPTGGGR